MDFQKVSLRISDGEHTRLACAVWRLAKRNSPLRKSALRQAQDGERSRTTSRRFQHASRVRSPPFRSIFHGMTVIVFEYLKQCHCILFDTLVYVLPVLCKSALRRREFRENRKRLRHCYRIRFSSNLGTKL
jgi:hypothetical protein